MSSPLPKRKFHDSSAARLDSPILLRLEKGSNVQPLFATSDQEDKFSFDFLRFSLLQGVLVHVFHWLTFLLPQQQIEQQQQQQAKEQADEQFVKSTQFDQLTPLKSTVQILESSSDSIDNKVTSDAAKALDAVERLESVVKNLIQQIQTTNEQMNMMKDQYELRHRDQEKEIEHLRMDLEKQSIKMQRKAKEHQELIQEVASMKSETKKSRGEVQRLTTSLRCQIETVSKTLSNQEKKQSKNNMDYISVKTSTVEQIYQNVSRMEQRLVSIENSQKAMRLKKKQNEREEKSDNTNNHQHKSAKVTMSTNDRTYNFLHFVLIFILALLIHKSSM